MIFPRYHQLDCVRKLVAEAREHSPGTNYLIQHSAGNGKSNTIAWLAHRLASLCTGNDQKVFDAIIVVTDRVALDQQLQTTIYQFEHKQGVVRKIEIDYTQLTEALASNIPIVITTLQKFPFVTEKIDGLPMRRYAVIIDEAHSSQGGETATELKDVLAGAAIKPISAFSLSPRRPNTKPWRCSARPERTASRPLSTSTACGRLSTRGSSWMSSGIKRYTKPIIG